MRVNIIRYELPTFYDYNQKRPKTSISSMNTEITEEDKIWIDSVMSQFWQVQDFLEEKGGYT